jgi:hypothetical protein
MRFTNGETNITVGKAITNEKLQALSHIDNKPSTIPKLKMVMVMVNDIILDINNAMKNE